MVRSFNIIPTTGEFLIYRDKVNNRYVAVTNDDMVEVRKLKNTYGEYADIPDTNLVEVIPLTVEPNRSVVGLDIDLLENIPCNHLEVIDIVLP